MKAMYICEDLSKIDYVYGTAQKKRIAAMLGEEPGIWQPGCDTHDTQILFSTWGMPAFTEAELAEKFPSLRAVFYAAGTVQAFARPLLERGVRVFSAWQANGVPVAQFALAQILLSCKGYFGVESEAKTSRKQSDTLFRRYPGIYEEKIGLLGCGAIGSLLSKMLHDAAPELQVLVFDPFLPDERAALLGVTKTSLEEIFTTCLVVSNHLANLPATVGIIKREMLLSMRPYSTFINTGRGPQLNEQDLYDMLVADPTRTALLDVMTDEEQSDTKPILRLPNCRMTPHIAGSANNEVHRMAEWMADALAEWQRGGMPACEVTKQMLSTMA